MINLVNIENDALGLGAMFGPAFTTLSSTLSGYLNLPRIYIENKIVTNAQYEKINKTAEALKNSNSILKYKSLDSLAEIESIPNMDNGLNQRSIARMLKEELMKQDNLETIAIKAADLLRETDEKPKGSISSNWLNRFIDDAKLISDEDLQNLWSRILAEETKEPGSHSLRTLDVIKNLTMKEARIIEKVCKTRIEHAGSSFLLALNNKDYEKLYKYGYEDVLFLQELKILLETDVQLKNESKVEKGNRAIYNIGSKSLLEVNSSKTTNQDIPVILFSKIGIEIIKLIDLNEPDKMIIEHFASVLGTKNKEFFLADENYNEVPDDLTMYKKIDIQNDEKAD